MSDNTNTLFGTHKHHIVFRSQGGLDFDLNLIEMSMEEHEGDRGPHKNREKDLILKRELQRKLFKLFPVAGSYDIETISQKLGRTRRYFEPHFRKVPNTAGLYKSEDIIRHLMGGQLY